MKICAVITSFNIGNEFRENFLSYVNDLDYLVIVDNSSNEDTKEMLRDLAKDYQHKVNLVINDQNLGLARAQNIGVRIALELSYDFILFLDHDSKASVGMVDKLKQAYIELSKDTKDVAIISANIQDEEHSKEMIYLSSCDNLTFKRKGFKENKYLDVLTVISSGSMVSSHLFKEIGMFREDFSIDYVDFEYCLRAIDKGYRIFAVKDAILYHKLGNSKIVNFLSAKIRIKNHHPLRRYSIYRNRIWVWKLYLFKIPAFVFHDIITSMTLIAEIILFEPNKMANLCQIFKGICHGIYYDAGEQ